MNELKAHIETPQEAEKKLQKSEIVRIFKIMAFVLCQDFGFGYSRVKKAIDLISQYSQELYQDPEKWIQVDDYLYNKKNVRMFPKENIEERIEASRDIHKEAGQKWRQY